MTRPIPTPPRPSRSLPYAPEVVPTTGHRAPAYTAHTYYAYRDAEDFNDDAALARLARLSKRHDPWTAATIMGRRGYWDLPEHPKPPLAVTVGMSGWQDACRALLRSLGGHW